MGGSRITVVRADIATLEVDAIVNAANSTLLGGGGVDGAIHYAAGPKLKAACRTLGGCNTGEAKLTPGFELRAKWIIHTVGPVWKGGTRNEPLLLRQCYLSSLTIARDQQFQTLAFPAISTGAYAYPIREATEVAVTTVRAFLKEHLDAPSVVFCCYDRGDLAEYQRAIAQHAA